MTIRYAVYSIGVLSVAVDLWNSYGNPHLPGYGATLDPDKYAIPSPTGGYADSLPFAAHFYLILGLLLILIATFAL